MELSVDTIWLATAAVDMRTGIDGLSLHVQQVLGRPPCDGTAYVFANRRRTRLKLVLTHELAYYRRIRFGKASEALAGEQRLLFEETVDTDLAAIEEELDTQAPIKRPRKRAGRQPANRVAPHRTSP